MLKALSFQSLNSIKIRRAYTSLAKPKNEGGSELSEATNLPFQLSVDFPYSYSKVFFVCLQYMNLRNNLVEIYISPLFIALKCNTNFQNRKEPLRSQSKASIITNYYKVWQELLENGA